MNMREVNTALAAEFGKGNVKVKRGIKKDVIVLWFKSDSPSKATVRKAEGIVKRFEESVIWFESEKVRS